MEFSSIHKESPGCSITIISGDIPVGAKHPVENPVREWKNAPDALTGVKSA